MVLSNDRFVAVTFNNLQVIKYSFNSPSRYKII